MRTYSSEGLAVWYGARKQSAATSQNIGALASERNCKIIDQTPARPPVSFTYDADGNLTNDGRWAYTWDGENRLKLVETASSARAAGVSRHKAAFVYDGQGRRVEKTATAYSEPLFSAVQVEYQAESGENPTGPVLATTASPDWNLAWTGAPAPGVPTHHWIAEITGTMQVPVTGSYTFNFTQGPMDAFRFYVDGNFVLNMWSFAGPRTGQVTLSLAAGQTYNLRCQFFTADETSSLQLQAAQSTGIDTVTRFIYDGWNLLAEVDSTDAITKTYVWGSDLSGSMQGAGGVGGLIFENLSDLSSPLYAPCYDGNGNVVSLVDMMTGIKSASYEYNAFGETIIADGLIASINPFRFSTKFFDHETTLLYYGLRYYSFETGRWLNRDPLQETASAGLYVFIDNEATGAVDSLGLWKLQFAYDRNFSVAASRGYVSVGARADIENGNGHLSVSLKGGVRFFLSEVLLGGGREEHW